MQSIARAESHRRNALRPAATGYGLAVLLLPILTIPSEPTGRELLTTLIAVAVAALTAALFARRASSRLTAWVGPVLVAVAGLLYNVTPPGAATALIALLLGPGVGLAVGWSGPRTDGRRSTGPKLIGLAAGVVTLGLVWLLEVEFWVAAMVGTVMSIVAVVVGVASHSRAAGEPERTEREVAADRRVRRSLVGVVCAGAALFVLWTGSNDPQLSWFGPVVWHAPDAGRRVALTFDDGPNEKHTLDIAHVLDENGVKGTFFMVGRAVEERPDIARTLVLDGHVVGNHSYDHDYTSWLIPWYPELDRTQREIESATGMCPRFFRPPHGQRTPFMNVMTSNRDMVTVMWSTSGADWELRDPAEVARRIVDRTGPGGIVLLHDGLDGDVASDQSSVVVKALPLIIEGLKDKGLEPVALTDLIAERPYLDDC